jgi:hypothetical protein
MRVGNICFSDEFFTTTSSVGEAKRTLEDELRNFCILVEVRFAVLPQRHASADLPRRRARRLPRPRSAKVCPLARCQLFAHQLTRAPCAFS